MHPRLALDQVCFPGSTPTGFIEAARAIGVNNLVLTSPGLLDATALAEARAVLSNSKQRVAAISHPFAVYPNLADDDGRAAETLRRVLDAAEQLGSPTIYMLTGGRGGLDWEGAAERFATLITPLAKEAQARGITLMIENASPLYADIHIAHSLSDTIALAEQAGIGVCIELFFCWAEGRLREHFGRAMKRCSLVQVSDYVPGDRSLPARAVPGDGVVPLEAILRDILDAGYQGVFDLELIGPRIDAEGHAAAATRGAERLSAILTRLGA